MDISKVILPSGSTYDIKDSQARTNITSNTTEINNLKDLSITQTEYEALLAKLS